MLKHAMLVAMALVAAALLVAFSMSSAVAAQADDTMEVRANVVTVCTLSTPDMDFGDYVGAQINKDSVWDLACNTSNTLVSVWEWGFGGNFHDSLWHMVNVAGDELAYQQIGWEPWLPTDATGHTTFTLHMQLDGGQIVPAGSYSDTLFTHAYF